MYLLLLLLAAFQTSSSAPITSPDFIYPSIPITTFGCELPESSNTAPPRTMLDIVWSCFVTIFACTWVAIHPNTPDSSRSGWCQFKHRLLVMVYAALVPEFIMLWALRQRIGAAQHVKEYNKKFHPKTEVEAAEPPRTQSIPNWLLGSFDSILSWFRPSRKEPGAPWTLTHGFLLEMRGLAKYKDGKLVGFVKRVEELSEPFDFPEDEITDKSKGDFLTKLIVVLQTTWFMLQCLARAVTNLPVTNLELVTAAFTFLNILTYSFWWYKPQNMRIPITYHIQTQTGPYTSPKEPWLEGNDGSFKLAEEKMETWDELPSTGPFLPFLNQPFPEGGETQCEESALLPSTSASMSWRLKGPRHYTNYVTKRVQRVWKALYIHVLCHMANQLEVELPEDNYTTWIIFAPFIIAMWPVMPIITMMANDTEPEDGDKTSLLFYSSVDGFREEKTVVPFCIIAAAFGCLHLIPIWSFSFPSVAETILWAISAVMISIHPVFLLVYGWIRRHNKDQLVNSIVTLVVTVFGNFAYLLSRLVLLILSITTLRSIPQGTLKDIAWTTFLPHW